MSDDSLEDPKIDHDPDRSPATERGKAKITILIGIILMLVFAGWGSFMIYGMAKHPEAALEIILEGIIVLPGFICGVLLVRSGRRRRWAALRGDPWPPVRKEDWPPPLTATDLTKPRVPYSPAALFDLFVYPQRFFTTGTDFNRLPYQVAAAWPLGIAIVAGVVNPQFYAASDDWYGWGRYWPILLIAGFVTGIIAWGIGGWWYLVRLGWAGDIEASEKKARTVYVYTDLVQNAPLIVILVLATVLYDNFKEFSTTGYSAWIALLALFKFWSVFISYRSATAVFNLKRSWGLVWFAVLPAVFYLVTAVPILAIFKF